MADASGRRGPAHHPSRPQTQYAAPELLIGQRTAPSDVVTVTRLTMWQVYKRVILDMGKVAFRVLEVNEPLLLALFRQRAERGRPALLAEKTQRMAVALLSPAARDLYADELRDELYDLAEHRAPRRRQLGCVLRQAAYAWKLTRLARSEQAAAVGGGE